MLRYMKSELYRISHTKGVYVFFGVINGLFLAMNLVLWYFGRVEASFPYDTTRFSFSMPTTAINVILLLTLLLGSIVFTDEYKHRALMNSIAFGCSRETLYIGKWLVSLLVSVIELIATLGLFIGSGYLLLENSGPEPTMDLLQAVVFNVPIFIAGMTGAITLLFLMKSATQAIWTWLGIILAFPMVIQLLGLKFEIFARLGKWLIYNIVQEIGITENGFSFTWGTPEGMFRCLMAGVLGIAVFLVLGLTGIHKKEMN